MNYEKRPKTTLTAPEEPLYPPTEIGGIVGDNLRKPFDMKQIIARLVDGSRFQEFKEHYGTSLVTGEFILNFEVISSTFTFSNIRI